MSTGKLPFTNGDSKKPSAHLDKAYERGRGGAAAGGGDGGDDDDTCICARPRHGIKCINCLNEFTGRLRLACPVHPEVFFLMDIFNCSKCGASREFLVFN